MDNAERLTLEILLHAGDARALAHEALNRAEAGNFDGAESRLEAAQNKFAAAHRSHAELLHLSPPPSLLLVHALDQLMAVQTELGLIRHLIRQSRIIHELAARLGKPESKGVTDMAEKQVTIPNESGLHARPAALLVREAGQFTSTVKLVKNGKEVDAKSLLGVMSLAAKKGDVITVKAEGNDAEQAAETLARFLEQLS